MQSCIPEKIFQQKFVNPRFFYTFSLMYKHTDIYFHYTFTPNIFRFLYIQLCYTTQLKMLEITDSVKKQIPPKIPRFSCIYMNGGNHIT